jgi:hypothetical protein
MSDVVGFDPKQNLQVNYYRLICINAIGAAPPAE